MQINAYLDCVLWLNAGLRCFTTITLLIFNPVCAVGPTRLLISRLILLITLL